MKIQMHVIFKGHVQKVGFRWTILEHAERYSLVGTVSNLSDGSVEVFAEGEKKQLELFLKAIKSSPGAAKIREMQISYPAKQDHFIEFRIV